MQLLLVLAVVVMRWECFIRSYKMKKLHLYGVEAAGKGIETEKHAATLTKGSVGVLHGSMTYLLQNEEGQIQEAHSISAGLDYPGVGPEHSLLKDIGRVYLSFHYR